MTPDLRIAFIGGGNMGRALVGALLGRGHPATRLAIGEAYETTRLLTHKAAWLVDQGDLSSIISAYAKAYGADAAMRVTTDAVQVFGGYGFIKEYPVEKLMRDAKLLQIYEGTSQIQRMVIAKNLLGRG